MNRAQVLAEAGDSRHRALICHKWATRAREDWYHGQQNMVQRAMDRAQSGAIKYKGMDVQAVQATARREWSTSAVAKDLASLEQMYSRWVTEYSLMALITMGDDE